MSRRGENIYKRRDGRWEGRYIESYSPAGKAKYHSVYGHTYKEVKLKLQNHPPHHKNTDFSLTICDWIENYITSQKERLKISTCKVYERYFNNHIQPFFKTVKLCKVDSQILQEFIDSLNELAPSTVKGIFSLVREALKTAHKKGYINAVWINIDIPKERKSSVNVFSKSEQQMLETALDFNAYPNEIGILICLYTGLRIGEVCGLKWEDINFCSGILSVTLKSYAHSLDEHKRTSMERLAEFRVNI